MIIKSFEKMVVVLRRRSVCKCLLILSLFWTVLFALFVFWNGHDVNEFTEEKSDIFLRKFGFIFTNNNDNIGIKSYEYYDGAENDEEVDKFEDELEDSDKSLQEVDEIEDELENSLEEVDEIEDELEDSREENEVEIETTTSVTSPPTTPLANETTNATIVDVFLPPMESLHYGELGEPVLLPANISQDTRNKISNGWARMAFNEYVSDLISIKRKLPDVRCDLCKSKVYSDNLPATSVILCFHNEAWSTLLRSVHSILDRSPVHLITEIILVDDFSDLGKKLIKYFIR